MKGWGSVTCLVGFGLSIASGCGSRTASFDDLYYDPNGVGGDDDGDDIGGTSTGGTTAGRGATAGISSGGTRPISGAGPGGAPIGGSSTAGSPGVAGSAPVAGTGGVSGGAAGAGGFGIGGTPVAGFGGVGAVSGVAGVGGEPQTCQSCLISSCAGTFIQCLQDVGCIEIIACAQRERCEGFDCYSDDSCKGVIDRWGGPAGKSMNQVLVTFGCAVNAGCMCN